MLSFNLMPIFRLRGIENPRAFLIKAGISRQCVSTILNRNTGFLRLNHIEIICEKLNCTPNDIIRWTPNNNNSINENHPLTKLKKTESNNDTYETLKLMPLDVLVKLVSEAKRM